MNDIHVIPERLPGLKFIKTHPDAVLPSCAHTGIGIGDTGYDLTAVESWRIPAKGSTIVPVGLKVAYIQPGFWFKIEARSGLSFKHNILPHPGIIDNGYRGSLDTKLYNLGDKDYMVNKGDKIAQLVIYPLYQTDIEWTEEVIESARGEKGFGSTDEKPR